MSKKKIEPLSKADHLYAKELIKKLDGTIRRVVHSYLDADLSSEFEDIVQSIYETICMQLDDFKKCDNQEALIVVIAARRVWRTQRNHKTTEELSDNIPAAEYDRGLKDILPPSISRVDREILTSAYEHQDTMVELAADLDCPASTLRQRLKRAKIRLKKALEEST